MTSQKFLTLPNPPEVHSEIPRDMRSSQACNSRAPFRFAAEPISVHGSERGIRGTGSPGDCSHERALRRQCSIPSPTSEPRLRRSAFLAPRWLFLSLLHTIPSMSLSAVKSKSIVIISGIGNAQGTGASCARLFASQLGYRIALVARPRKELQDLRDEIKKDGGEVS